MGKPIWRVYYGDGATFDSNQGTVEQVPAFGVQAIIQDCPVEKKNLVSHYDYYFWDKDESRWMGCDFAGLIDALARCKGPVKFGRYLPMYKFEAILKLASEDKDFEGAGVWTVNQETEALPP